MKRTNRGFSVFGQVRRTGRLNEHPEVAGGNPRREVFTESVRLQESSQATPTPRCWLFVKSLKINENPRARHEVVDVGYDLKPNEAARLRAALDEYLSFVGWKARK